MGLAKQKKCRSKIPRFSFYLAPGFSLCCFAFYGVAEQLAPFGESAVGSEDHCAFFVAGVDELEEQVRAIAVDGEVADLVDDQRRGARVEPDFLGQVVLALRLGQGLDEFGERGAVDAFAGLDGGDAEGGGEMALAGAGRAEEVDDLGALMKSSCPSARTRFLPSDGWKAKSKLSMVLGGLSRAVVNATPAWKSSGRRATRVCLTAVRGVVRLLRWLGSSRHWFLSSNGMRGAAVTVCKGWDGAVLRSGRYALSAQGRRGHFYFALTFTDFV